MRRQFDHTYPPGEWTAEGIETAIREASPGDALPTVDDRSTWGALRDAEETGDIVAALLAEAEDRRDELVPHLPASLFLKYERTGSRPGYEQPYRERRRRLALFALAACFDPDGGYLDPVLDHAWALCEQTTWTLPAHANLGESEFRDGLPVPDPDRRGVGLVTTSTARLLAEVDHLLGDRLHPALRERIRAEAETQVFRPYLDGDFWWSSPPTNNWNAVCNGNTIGAALRLVDDPSRIARIVETAAHNLRHYLAGFDADGVTPEGISYWNYGFGHYVTAAVDLASRTDGALDLLSPPVVDRIARFPVNVQLSPGRYPAFSDATEGDRPSPATLCLLGRALDAPGLVGLGRDALDDTPPWGIGTLRTLLAIDGGPVAEPPTPPRRFWAAGHGWWVTRARPDDADGLVVAAKGGHNDEPHNHNDCGSFVVHAAGESSVTDPGGQTYDDGYFGPDRYEYLAPRSLSHPVPHVNGCEQVAGGDGPEDPPAAEVIGVDRSSDADAVTMDLAGCYPDAAGLDALRRTITLERSDAPYGGRVRVDDRASFADAAPDRAFASVLIAHRPTRAVDGRLVIDGDRTRTTVTPTPDATIETTHAGTLRNERDDDVLVRDLNRAVLVPDESPDGEEVRLSLRIDVEPAGEGP